MRYYARGHVAINGARLEREIQAPNARKASDLGQMWASDNDLVFDGVETEEERDARLASGRRYRVVGRSGPLGRDLDREAADRLAGVSGGTVIAEPSQHPYEVTMSNGDQAEADTVEGVILAVRTMWDDNDQAPEIHVANVTQLGDVDEPVLATVRRMLLEWQILGTSDIRDST